MHIAFVFHIKNYVCTFSFEFHLFLFCYNCRYSTLFHFAHFDLFICFFIFIFISDDAFNRNIIIIIILKIYMCISLGDKLIVKPWKTKKSKKLWVVKGNAINNIFCFRISQHLSHLQNFAKMKKKWREWNALSHERIISETWRK